MIIENLTVQNFRNFEEKELIFHPQFNLIVGINGTGKTALLDALSVSIATWLIGFKDRLDSSSIDASDARLISQQSELGTNYENQYPVVIQTYGSILDQQVSWIRSKHSPKGNTRYKKARDVIDIAQKADSFVRANQKINLPIVAYYGTMRLWSEPKKLKYQSKVKNPDDLSKKEGLSRLDGYRFSVDPRISTKRLIQWFARQSWIEFQKTSSGSQTAQFKTFDLVRKAILQCIEGATNLFFDAERGELMVTIEVDGHSSSQPFANLSDGQRSLLTLVADIAQKAIALNPHLNETVLQETNGVVLIDELDLHLHPRWQRNLIENLRQTFPKIQFICTTHSPFLIQSLRSGEELIMLDGLPTAQLANKPIEEIARDIMGIKNPQVSARYEEKKTVAKTYYELLEEATNSPEELLEAYKKQLADSIAPYADDPAYQAFLEIERIAKIGS